MIERGDTGRPSGRRFGVLVHATLASIDLDADVDAIQALAAINGRFIAASDEEMKAAVVVVGASDTHPAHAHLPGLDQRPRTWQIAAMGLSAPHACANATTLSSMQRLQARNINRQVVARR